MYERMKRGRKSSFEEVNGINAADWEKVSSWIEKTSKKTWEKMRANSRYLDYRRHR